MFGSMSECESCFPGYAQIHIHLDTFFYCFLQFFKFTLRVIFIFIFQFCSAGLNSVSNIQDSVCWMHFLCTPVNSDL